MDRLLASRPLEMTGKIFYFLIKTVPSLSAGPHHDLHLEIPVTPCGLIHLPGNGAVRGTQDGIHFSGLKSVLKI